jgi:hypothetical protein
MGHCGKASGRASDPDIHYAIAGRARAATKWRYYRGKSTVSTSGGQFDAAGTGLSSMLIFDWTLGGSAGKITLSPLWACLGDREFGSTSK